MSEAYECDRCGGLREGSPHTAMTVEDGFARTVHHTRHRAEGEVKPEHIDLCRACLNDLRKWYQEAGGDPEDIEYE